MTKGMQMQKEEYITKDFGLSVFLAIVKPDKIKFQRLEQINEREVNFVFSNPIVCSDLAMKYFSDDGLINARAYAGKMRDFKAMLYSVIEKK